MGKYNHSFFCCAYMEQDYMDITSKSTVSHNDYLVKDIGEAAALLCKSTKFLRLQREESFYWFVFENRQLCEQLSEQYWSGELVVVAKQFNDSLRTLKDRLFARK